MSERDDGGPMSEMSLRDYLAGQALIALMHLATHPDFKTKSGKPADEKDFAISSYGLADALLAERAKPREPRP